MTLAKAGPVGTEAGEACPSVSTIADQLEVYTTAEPCPMCMGAIVWAGIPKVFFGSTVKHLLACGYPQIDMMCSEGMEGEM